MRITTTILGITALLTAAAACGDDDNTGAVSSEPADGGGLLDDAGSLSGLEVLNPLCGAGDGGTADDCDACVAANCASGFEQCFGSGWQSNLGGTCSDFGDCVMQCECGDPDCFGVCTGQLESNASDPCLSCVRSLLECELQHCDAECQDDSPDAGADSGTESDGGARDGG